MTPLTRNQKEQLCGRETEAGAIVENCRWGRLTVVTSLPGMGVTSLFEAGIGPALRREGFLVVVFRDWQGKYFAARLRELIEAAVREETGSWVPAEAETLAEMLRQARETTGKPVAILLDQFEDYLRFHTRTPLAADFDAELAQAIEGRHASFVIGMQVNGLMAFERFNEHIPNLLGNRIELEPLTRDAARQAVVSQARARGLEVAAAAIDALVSAPVVVRDGDRVHPFFLTTATSQLLDTAVRARILTVELPMIEIRGGVDRIALESLDGTVNDLNPSHLELMFHWCNILISPDKHRIAVTEKGLTDYAGKLKRFVLTLLPIVTGTHVIRSVEMPDGIRYEIARECLTPILRDWWERRTATLTARQRALFRVRSMSIAAACITVLYVVWIILSWKDPA